jgi:hypothetical protein
MCFPFHPNLPALSYRTKTDGLHSADYFLLYLSTYSTFTISTASSGHLSVLYRQYLYLSAIVYYLISAPATVNLYLCIFSSFFFFSISTILYWSYYHSVSNQQSPSLTTEIQLNGTKPNYSNELQIANTELETILSTVSYQLNCPQHIGSNCYPLSSSSYNHCLNRPIQLKIVL